MKKLNIHITAKEAKCGCERILSLPKQANALRIPIEPGIKDGKKIQVHNAIFLNESGHTTTSPVQVTIYIGYQRCIVIAITYIFLLLFCGLLFLFGATMNPLTDYDNAYQAFLLSLAEMVYQVEPYFMLFLSVVLSFIFWVVPRPDKLKSPITYLILIIVSFLLVLAGYIYFIRENYTYIPNINLYHESLQSAQSRFQVARLQISDENIDFNDLAQRQMKEGQEPYSYYFKVYQTDPSPNTFVYVGTNVRLYVTWINEPSTISITNESGSNTELPDTYNNINTDFIYPFNADMVTLYTHVAGAKLITEGFNETSLGIFPTEDILLEACLINFDTGKQVDSKTAILGDEIIFSNIPNGTYYYIISCNGYKTAIPDSPFKLERNYSKEADILPWGVNLEKEESQLSSTFKVRIQNANGNIIQNTEIDVRAVHEDNPSPNSFIHYSLYSDENGYLTSWHGIDNRDFYDLVDFQLYEDCYLEARLNEYDEFVRVQIKDGTGICTFSD